MDDQLAISITILFLKLIFGLNDEECCILN